MGGAIPPILLLLYIGELSFSIKQKTSGGYTRCVEEGCFAAVYPLPERCGKSGGEKEETPMIDVTKMDGSSVTINAELIEIVEETPDTVVTLTTGKKIIIKESRQDVKNLVKSYKRECISIGMES